jgi:gliding motility-associated-like protein
MFLSVAMLFAVHTGYSQGVSPDEWSICVGTRSVVQAERSEPGTVFDYELKNKITDAVIFLIEREQKDSLEINWTYPAGTYQLGVRELTNREDGCQGEWVWTDIRLNAPTPLVLPRNVFRLCGKEGVTITFNENEFSGYRWSDTRIANTLITQTGTYELTATDLNGCESTASVTVAASIEASLNSDTIMCSPEFRLSILNPTQNPDGTIYTWWTSDNLTGTNGKLIKSGGDSDLDVYDHDTQHDVLYWVHADYEDCTVGDTTVIIACPEEDAPVNIPNAFTPNSDGENDIWNIQSIDQYPNCSVEVFDRWGRRVFIARNGYTTPWDGRDLGKKELPTEAYYYIIKLNDGKHTKPIVGTIHIIK